MTISNDFDRLIGSWLETAGPTDIRPDVTTAALSAARRVAQRGRLAAWLAGPSAWPRYGRGPVIDRLPRSARIVVVLALVAALAGAAVAAGGLILRQLDKRPAPVTAPSLVHAGVPGTGWYSTQTIGLADGRIVISGFGSDDGRLAEIFDPATGASTPIPGVGVSITPQGAALLPDGRILIIGWQYAEPASDGHSLAWVLNPTTLRLTPVGPMTTDRFSPGMATLPDGRVILAGGIPDQEPTEALASVEFFDPRTEAFMAAGKLAAPRYEHALTVLPDARVLVSGGAYLVSGDGQEPTADASLELEIYDPTTGLSTHAAILPNRAGLAAPALLRGGAVFIPGRRTMRCGRHGVDPIPAYRFDPATLEVTTLPPLPHDIQLAVAMQDGRALVAGSWDGSPNGCETGAPVFRDAWIGLYDLESGVTLESRNPMTGLQSLALDTDSPYRSAAILPDGRIALVAAQTFSELGPAIDIFKP